MRTDDPAVIWPYMISPRRSRSRNTSHVAKRPTRLAFAISTRGASACVVNTPTGLPDCTSSVSSSSSTRSVRQIASNEAQFRAALPVPPYTTRSSGRSATSGSRLFINIRRAASWTHPLQDFAVPRGAFTRRIFLHGDRKSTRLNSSHVRISYAVFCLKKKKKSVDEHDPVRQQYATERDQQ